MSIAYWLSRISGTCTILINFLPFCILKYRVLSSRKLTHKKSIWVYLLSAREATELETKDKYFHTQSSVAFESCVSCRRLSNTKAGLPQATRPLSVSGIRYACKARRRRPEWRTSGRLEVFVRMSVCSPTSEMLNKQWAMRCVNVSSYKRFIRAHKRM